MVAKSTFLKKGKIVEMRLKRTEQDFPKIWPGYAGTGSLWLNRGLL